MKSIKCPECGFVGWADVERCKKCGVIRLADPAGEDQMSSPSYRDYQPAYPRYSTEGQKKGLAVASLVLGIVGFFTLGVLGVGAVIGTILAIVAMKRAKREPEEYGGGGVAIAGLVTNILCLATMIPVLLIAAIAIPNLLAARRAANEGSSIATLRSIHSAQATYQATRGNGSYGTLEQLTDNAAGEALLSPELADGTRNGYRFTVELNTSRYDNAAGFQVNAVPLEYGKTGNRSFYVDETGVIRGENNRGAVASELSPPLDDDSFASRPSQRRSYSEEEE
jgi:type II secretory pathway pseudopilin PulG